MADEPYFQPLDPIQERAGSTRFDTRLNRPKCAAHVGRGMTADRVGMHVMFTRYLAERSTGGERPIHVAPRSSTVSPRSLAFDRNCPL